MMLRVLSGFLLAVMLCVTSVTAAVARGQMAGAVDLVVCSGAGSVTVTLDAAGQPVRHVHHCPVCTAASAAVAGASAPCALRPVTRADVLVRRGLSGQARALPLVAVARGPPVRNWPTTL